MAQYRRFRNQLGRLRRLFGRSRLGEDAVSTAQSLLFKRRRDQLITGEDGYHIVTKDAHQANFRKNLSKSHPSIKRRR